jgi:hypothetical protein
VFVSHLNKKFSGYRPINFWVRNQARKNLIYGLQCSPPPPPHFPSTSVAFWRIVAFRKVSHLGQFLVIPDTLVSCFRVFLILEYKASLGTNTATGGNSRKILYYWVLLKGEYCSNVVISGQISVTLSITIGLTSVQKIWTETEQVSASRRRKPTSETSVNSYQARRRNNAEHRHLNARRREKLKSTSRWFVIIWPPGKYGEW